MRNRLLAPVVASVAVLLCSAALVAAPANAAGTGNCTALDSGRKVGPGNAVSTVVTAPGDQLISSYCVKSAGTAGKTGAPVYITVSPAVHSLVITHPDGGNLTHYSLTYQAAASGTPVDDTPGDTPGGDTPGDTPATTPAAPFDWNWQYTAPTCTATTVDYPSNIPSGQANDANIRFRTASGQFTLNFHNNTGTWSGTHAFTYTDHPNWPAGLTSYDVVWVQIGGTNYHWQGSVECRPVVVVPPVDVPPFDWNWEYPTPTCTALNVVYPSNIPSGQANDANIRFESNVGQFTLNFHNNTGTWSGAHAFSYTDHPNWPAGVTSYRVVWTQVGGTNYHWQGNVACGADSTPPTTVPPAGPDASPAAEVLGFDTDDVTVRKGSSLATRMVQVRGASGLALERLKHGSWSQVSHVSTDARGVARVVFPRLTKRGSYSFRLSVPSSHDAAGTCTGVLRVRVR